MAAQRRAVAARRYVAVGGLDSIDHRGDRHRRADCLAVEERNLPAHGERCVRCIGKA